MAFYAPMPWPCHGRSWRGCILGYVSSSGFVIYNQDVEKTKEVDCMSLLLFLLLLYHRTNSNDTPVLKPTK